MAPPHTTPHPWPGLGPAEKVFLVHKCVYEHREARKEHPTTLCQQLNATDHHTTPRGLTRTTSERTHAPMHTHTQSHTPPRTPRTQHQTHVERRTRAHARTHTGDVAWCDASDDASGMYSCALLARLRHGVMRRVLVWLKHETHTIGEGTFGWAVCFDLDVSLSLCVSMHRNVSRCVKACVRLVDVCIQRHRYCVLCARRRACMYG